MGEEDLGQARDNERVRKAREAGDGDEGNEGRTKLCIHGITYAAR